MNDDELRHIARLFELSIGKGFADIGAAAIWARATAAVYREYLRRGLGAGADAILDMCNIVGIPS